MNHGAAVSAFVRQQQEARVEGGHPGIGAQVSEFARSKQPDLPPVDFEDGVIRVVKDEGGTQTFATFADALAYADDGDTLQVGAGIYAEAINLDERVSIVGEQGAVLDGSGIVASAGTQGTLQLFDGFSGGSVSGLEVVAVDDGNALVTIIGQEIEDVDLVGNIFDAGDNTAGSLVYLNPGADGFVVEGNTFEGEALAASPLLGIEGDNVEVTDNTFGETPETYAKLEIFNGPNGVSTDIVLVGNVGLDLDDVVYA